LLTPELKTRWTTIGAIQLSIAGGMLSQRTMPFSALGIVILYAIAIRKYGFFHLADYPVFLGVAAYLALIGIQSTFFGVRPIDVLRWTTSVTLMWSSIEKWAYPEWSYPLLYLHPELTFGFSPEYYMRAAGAVEFALAFALLWTPLVRRVAAALLIGILVSAVFEFGKIDLIGHSLFVVTLLGILADDGGKLATLRSASLLPVRYAAAWIVGVVLRLACSSFRYHNSLNGARLKSASTSPSVEQHGVVLDIAINRITAKVRPTNGSSLDLRSTAREGGTRGDTGHVGSGLSHARIGTLSY
jgi:hypothetical protein